MYFQTGQVIFVPEWPKGEFVSILASFCVWKKSLMCKDVVNRDSTCQSIFRRLCIAKKDRRFQIPCQPSGRRVIPSGCPTVHCSIRPDDVSYRPDARQTSIIRPDDVSFRLDPPLYQEASVPSCIRPDVPATRLDVHQ
jgi:hypothetical protein